MKLIASITLSSAACGFFAGLFSARTPLALVGLVLVVLLGWQWIAAEMMIAELSVKEDEI